MSQEDTKKQERSLPESQPVTTQEQGGGDKPKDDIQDENVDLRTYPMEHPVLGTLENEDGHYEKLGYTKHPELGWIQ